MFFRPFSGGAQSLRLTLVGAVSLSPLVAHAEESPPRPLDFEAPAYPDEAVDEVGEVVVTVRVGVHGDLLEVVSIEGPELFRASALEATRELTFLPALRDGSPVEGTTTLTWVFAPPEAEEIVIHAQRQLQDAHSTTTLTEEDLVKSKGSDLAQTVANIPGVTLSRGSANASKPIIRGQIERRLLLLYDGVRHESQKWGLDHAPELDPFAAGSIQVVKGASGVRFGPDAIGGVVLIDPRPLRLNPGWDGTVHLVGALNGRRLTSALRLDGAHAALPGFSWRVEGDFSKGTALDAPHYRLGNTASQEWNLGTTLVYRKDLSAFQLSYRHYDLTAGVCFCIQNSTPDDLLTQWAADAPLGSEGWKRTYSIERPFQAVSHEVLLARASFPLGQAGNLKTTYAFQYNHRREFDQARDSVTGPQYEFDLRTHSLDIAFSQAERPIGNSMLTGGAGLSSSFQENVYAGLPLIPNHRAFNAGVYAFERLSQPTWSVEVGARYDHQSRTSFLTDSAFQRHQSRGTLSEQDCTLEGDVARCERRFHGGSLSIGGIVQPVPETLEFRLDLSSASRFPNGDELYMHGSAPTAPVYALGDPSLKTETTWGASPTVGVHGNWFELEASTYANYIHDFIQFAPDRDSDGQLAFDVTAQGSFPRYSYRSLQALFYGADGSISLGGDSPLFVALQGSLVRGRDIGAGEWLAFIPPDQGQATLGVRPPLWGPFHDTEVSLRGTWVAEQTRVEAGSDFVPPPKDYFLLGASIHTEIPIGRQSLRVGLQASNLLNTPYRNSMSLIRYFADEPGRDIRLQLGFDFQP